MRITNYLMSKIYKPILEIYLSKDRVFNREGIEIIVASGIFHPRFFGTTLFLVEELKTQELVNKSFLEVGCGSGFISLFASKKRADSTGIDINPKAIQYLKENALKNRLNVLAIHSNLFENVKKTFDFVVVNPPFFKRNPKNDSEHAWYAGENLEYFELFFKTLNQICHTKTIVWMVLADNCPLKEIEGIAAKNCYFLEIVKSKKIIFETQTIFQIKPTEN